MYALESYCTSIIVLTISFLLLLFIQLPSVVDDTLSTRLLASDSLHSLLLATVAARPAKLTN